LLWQQLNARNKGWSPVPKTASQGGEKGGRQTSRAGTRHYSDCVCVCVCVCMCARVGQDIDQWVTRGVPYLGQAKPWAFLRPSKPVTLPCSPSAMIVPLVCLSARTRVPLMPA
jgi:hypothetical protein